MVTWSGSSLTIALGLALGAPHMMSAQSASPAGLVEWSATIGEWHAGSEPGVLQISAGRLSHEELRQDLALIWRRWDPDTQTYVVATSLVPVAICGATAFYDTALALSEDASLKFVEVALQIRFPAEEPGTGEHRTLFMVIDKIERKYRVLNCR